MNGIWCPRAMALDQGISAECGMKNCELSLMTSSHPCLSLGPHCLALHLTALVLATHSTYTLYWDSTKSAGSFFMVMGHGAFFFFSFLFSPFDGWLMFDGLRYMSFCDVTSKAGKHLSLEVQNVCGDYSEIRDSSEYSCATSDTLLNGTYNFEFGVKSLNVQTTFSFRSACFFPEDLPVFFFFLFVLRGTQRTLTGVQPLVPKYRSVVSMIP